MIKIKKEELTKLFYLCPQIGNRPIVLIPAFDGDRQIHVWRQQSNGQLLAIKPLNIVEGHYLAKEKQAEVDIYLNFLNFFYQRAANSNIFPILSFIEDDIHNLATSVVKLETFLRMKREIQLDIARFARTELEYIFALCRSLFDNLQRVISLTWKSTRLLDSTVKVKELPESFAGVVIKDKKIRSAIEIQNRWGLPRPWAQFYENQGSFFQHLRRIRDGIQHYGVSLDYIYVTEQGFAVAADHKQFSYFQGRYPQEPFQNNLILLRPILSEIAQQTFSGMEKFTEVISRIIKFPEEMAPGYRLYMRGYHLYELKRLLEETIPREQLISSP